MSGEPAPNLSELARQAKLHAESLRAAGVEWLPRGPALDRTVRVDTPEENTVTDEPQPAPESAEDTRRRELKVLAGEVSGCTRCAALASTRTQTVFGVGPIDPDLCFVGEAPGGDEDRKGEPFVGAAGQLLDRILAACGLKREEVFICNILRCRPPGNRPPLPDEADHCREWLEKTLDLVRPKFLCVMGGSATKYLLGATLGITKLRGQWREYNGIPAMCTYHPSYLLRVPAAKKDVWEDMKALLARMGRPVPGK